jgi:hypothetical protein
MFEHFMSVEQLDQARGMLVHPVTGVEIVLLQYCASRHEFYRSITRGAWDWDPDEEWQGRISAGEDCQNGDPFPPHWRFDPFTLPRSAPFVPVD